MTASGTPADRHVLGPAFAGIRTYMRLPLVPPEDVQDLDAVVVGMPFDTGASFGVGARFGPEAVRSASALLRPFHSELNVDVFGRLRVADVGDAYVVPGYAEDSLARMTELVSALRARGVCTFGIGGDHLVTLPALRAAKAAYGPVGLVLFDSHPDTWEAFHGHPYAHSTPFRRAVEEGLIDPSKSIMCGLRGSSFLREDWLVPSELGFKTLPAHQMRQQAIETVVADIRARVGGAPAYVSFDLDFLDPAFAPGTGTPEIGGFASWEAQAYLRGLAGLQIVGGDVVEILPQLDPAGLTARAAATILFELLTLLALAAPAKVREARNA